LERQQWGDKIFQFGLELYLEAPGALATKEGSGKECVGDA